MQSIEALELQVASLKSLLSDYALRVRHAEQTAGHLMAQAHKEKWTDAQIKEFAEIVSKQIMARSQERAVQQQGILQATVIALGAALNEQQEDKKKKMLVNILRELSTSVQHLDKIATLESKKSQAK